MNVNIFSLHEVFHLCHVFLGELIRWNWYLWLVQNKSQLLRKSNGLGRFTIWLFHSTHTIYVSAPFQRIPEKLQIKSMALPWINKQRRTYKRSEKFFHIKWWFGLICVCGMKQLNGIIKILIYFNEYLTRELLILSAFTCTSTSIPNLMHTHIEFMYWWCVMKRKLFSFLCRNRAHFFHRRL